MIASEVRRSQPVFGNLTNRSSCAGAQPGLHLEQPAIQHGQPNGFSLPQNLIHRRGQIRDQAERPVESRDPYSF